MNIYITKNNEQLRDSFGGLVDDCTIVSDSFDDARALVQGMDGGKAWNLIRDRFVDGFIDVERIATTEEIARFG